MKSSSRILLQWAKSSWRASRGLKVKHPFIKEVRGKGLMIAIEFHEPPQLRGKIAWRLMHKIDQSLFTQIVVVPLLSQHRVLTQVAGHHMDVIKILPPLIITEKEINRFVGALDQTLDECQRFPGPMLELARNYARTAWRGTSSDRTPKPATNGNGYNGHNGHNGHNGRNGHHGERKRKRQRERQWPRRGRSFRAGRVRAGGFRSGWLSESTHLSSGKG